MKIFWSWQSDTPGKTGRFLVRDALRDAIDQLKESPDIEDSDRTELHLDQDIQGVTGSPDLARTIFDKIDASEVVVADVTLIGEVSGKGNSDKKLINSNVAIELGYAFRALTDKNVQLVFNEYYGIHEDLPFDLRHKGGAVFFNLPPDANRLEIEEQKKKLKDDFVRKLKPLLAGPNSRRSIDGGPYPWIATNVWYPGADGSIDAVRLHLCVRDYPETADAREGRASLSFLENVHAVVSIPVSVDPDSEGRHSCIVADKRSLQWNNDNAAFDPLGVISLNRPITVLEFQLTANRGQWMGVSILRRNGRTVNSETYLSGHFVSNGGRGRQAMSIFEEQANGTKKVDHKTGIILTKAHLMEFGLPARIFSPAEMAQMRSQLLRPQGTLSH